MRVGAERQAIISKQPPRTCFGDRFLHVSNVHGKQLTSPYGGGDE